MVYAQPSICSGEWDAQTSLGFWDTDRSSDLNQTTSPYNNQQKKKKRICRIWDFAIPTDHREKFKESEKKDKYLDLAWKLKKLCYMKATVILIVIGALGTVIKGLVTGLEDLEITGRLETIQSTALLRSARIQRRVRETWADLLSLKLQRKPIS